MNHASAFAEEVAKTVKSYAALQDEIRARTKTGLELKTSMQNTAMLLELLKKPDLVPDLTELLASEHVALQSMNQEIMDLKRKVDGQQATCKEVMRQLLSTYKLLLTTRAVETSVEPGEVQGVCCHDFAAFNKDMQAPKQKEDDFSESVKATHVAVADADVRDLAAKRL